MPKGETPEIQITSYEWLLLLLPYDVELVMCLISYSMPFMQLRFDFENRFHRRFQLCFAIFVDFGVFVCRTYTKYVAKTQFNLSKFCCENEK